MLLCQQVLGLGGRFFPPVCLVSTALRPSLPSGRVEGGRHVDKVLAQEQVTSVFPLLKNFVALAQTGF